MDAVSLLPLMIDKYKNCKTYSDSGFATGLMGINHFSTVYEAPNKFQFRWRFENSKNESSIFSDGTEHYAQYPRSGLNKVENIDLLIAGASGLSQLAAPLILSLLMPQKFNGGRDFFSLDFDDLVSSDSVRGIACYKLSGKESNGPLSVELWIEKSNYSCRRLSADFGSVSGQEALASIEVTAEADLDIHNWRKNQTRTLDELKKIKFSSFTIDTDFTDICFDELPSRSFDLFPLRQ